MKQSYITRVHKRLAGRIQELQIEVEKLKQDIVDSTTCEHINITIRKRKMAEDRILDNQKIYCSIFGKEY